VEVVMKRVILFGVAMAAFAGASSASADVVVMEDGRRIRGELVSVNRGTVLFDEMEEGSTRRNRLRLNRDEVVRIVFRERRGDGMGRRGRDEDGVFGRPRSDDDPYARDDDDYGRGRDDDELFGRGREEDGEGFGRGRGGEDDDDVLYRDDRPGRDTGAGTAGRSRLVTVSARQAWTDTGVDVRVGDILQFRPEGTIQWGSGRQDGAAGEANSPIDSRRPMPARPAGALLGRIGTSASDVFFVGDDRGSFRVRTAGRLYLGINDDYLGDNAGSFQVRISH
jgi:hypothetical protein